MRTIKQLRAAVTLLLLAGCTLAPEPLTKSQLIDSLKQDRQLMFAGNEDIVAELTLADAIARAITYNLDHRARAMEQALELNQLELDKFELLPDLTATAGYRGRSTFNATRSQDVDGAEASGAFSYSSDRSSGTFDLTTSWNILDFGVSYFSARQNTDRALIANERRRKVLYNILKEVEFSFWRMVAAQKLQQRIRSAMAGANDALANSEQVEAEKIRSPLDSLRFQKRLLNNMRRLQDIEKQLSTARIELAALINLPPLKPFRVVEPEGDRLQVPHWDAPVELMEKLAFHNNPDVHEKIYLTRISVDETRKAMAGLLPGVSLSLGSKYDSNSFLDNSQWFEWGTTLSVNILKLFQIPEQLKYSNANETVATYQRLALRMAVLAQVHIADSQYAHAVRDYRQADKIYRVDRRLADHMAARQQANAQSVLDRISQDIEAIASEMRRYQAYSEIAAAIGTIHATLGIGVVANDVATTDLQTLGDAVRVALDDRRSGRSLRRAVENLGEAEPAGAPMPEEKTAALPPAQQAASPSPLSPDNRPAPIAPAEPTPPVRLAPSGETAEVPAPARPGISDPAGPAATTRLTPPAPPAPPATAAQPAPPASPAPAARPTGTRDPVRQPAGRPEIPAGPQMFDIRLSQELGGNSVYSARLSCSDVRIEEMKWGSVRIRGRDQDQREVVGWAHEIFFGVARQTCETALRFGS